MVSLDLTLSGSVHRPARGKLPTAWPRGASTPGPGEQLRPRVPLQLQLACRSEVSVLSVPLAQLLQFIEPHKNRRK